MAQFLLVLTGVVLGFPGIMITGVALESSDMEARSRIQRLLLGVFLLCAAGFVWYLAYLVRG